VNAVAACLGTNVNHWISQSGGAPVEDSVFLGCAQAENVDDRIQVVTGVEEDFAAYGGNPNAIAIAGDAGDDALQDHLVA
jgi:hypothetical protein